MMSDCKYINKNGTCRLKGCYAYRLKCFTEDCCRCYEPQPRDVDAVPVVRCKDCRWWNRKYTTVGKCEKLADRDQEGGAQFDCNTDDDDFCSKGERKENY